MTKIDLAYPAALGLNIYWLLRLLAQLPPFVIELPIPDSEDRLLISLNLEIKS